MPTPRRGDAGQAVLAFLLLVFAGCGAPGDPMPPLLNIPERTTDLEASQQAGELIVRWTLPSLSTEALPVKDLNRVVLLSREAEAGPVDASAFEDGAQELASLSEPKPGERIERRFPLPAAQGKRVALAVKNYNHRGRSQGLSNLVVLEIAPPLSAPRDLKATTQRTAIRLEWGEVAGASGYRIYRGSGEKPQFSFLAAVKTPPFDDPNFEWNTPYSYMVRAYTEVSTGIAESSDSKPKLVVPKDTFAPSPPEGLRAVPGETAVELSWNLSPEPDTAGYHVYRRGSSGEPVRQNSELLTTPVFTDKNVQRQQKYVYTVTAVDDKANESGPSAAAEVVVP